jgi:hypothetical protein
MRVGLLLVVLWVLGCARAQGDTSGEGATKLRAPAVVANAAADPALLNPLVGPEIDLGVPPYGSAAAIQLAVAGNEAGVSLAAWLQYGPEGGVYATRISADGVALDNPIYPIGPTRAAAGLAVASNGSDWLVVFNSYELDGMGTPRDCVVAYGLTANGSRMFEHGVVRLQYGTTSGNAGVAFDGTSWLIA